MKKIALAIFGITMLHSPAFAAGGMEGGGGAVAVCRDQNRAIISAEILDVYEGKVRYGYAIPTSNDDPADQILAVLTDKIPASNFYRPLLRQAVVEVIQNMRFLPRGVGLNTPPDLGKDIGVVLPEGCAIEAVGFYEKNGTLKVARAIYQALSKSDRAAFLIHEAIYRLARGLGNADSSMRSRQLTALLFASGNNEAAIKHLMPSVIFDYEFTYGDDPDLAILPGQTPSSDITMRVFSSSSSPYLLEYKCYDADYENTFEPTKETALGNSVRNVNISGCLNLGGYVSGVEPGEYNSPINFTLQFLHLDRVIYETTGRVLGDQPKESVLFGAYLMRSEQSLPTIPQP